MSENQQALNHVVSMEDLTVDQVMKLIKRGIEFKNGAQLPYEDHPIVSNLFFEDSTRTHKSFEVAEIKLGLERLDFDVKNPQRKDWKQSDDLHKESELRF